MNRKDIRICSCGRIHFIDSGIIDEALEQNKNTLVICGGCGRTYVIGADIEPDWYEPDKMCYNMYTSTLLPNGSEYPYIFDQKFFETVEGKFKGFHKVIIDPGKRVMMDTGYYATAYDNGSGMFYDMQYPDFWKIKKTDELEDVLLFINKFQRDMKSVNMNWLLRSLTDEEAEQLSHYGVKGLNWKGTKWETEYNSR